LHGCGIVTRAKTMLQIELVRGFYFLHIQLHA
jgi:hypothetical protein